MDEVIRIGLDTSKSVFQVHGVNAQEHPVLRRRLTRAALPEFFSRLAPCVVALEACGASHHWARVLTGFGHDVRLIAPQLAKPYVMRGKNDAADAAALCEAASRPQMRFVPVKTPEQQAALMLAGVRDGLVRRRTQLANTIRGHAAEYGIVAALGLDKIAPLLERIRSEAGVPALARELFALLAEEYAQVEVRVRAAEARLRAWHRANPGSRRLAAIPGLGPVGATLLVIEDAGTEGLRLRARLFRLARSDAQGPFHRRQAEARRDHEGGRRDLAAPARGRRHGGDPAPAAQAAARCGSVGQDLGLAGRTARPQARQARGRGPRQQNCPHRLAHDGQRRGLRLGPCRDHPPWPAHTRSRADLS